MQHLEMDARALCDQSEFDKALQICDGVLSQHPQNAAFMALRRDIIGRRRKAVMELLRQFRSETLKTRLELMEQSLHRFPNEPFLQRSYEEAKREYDHVDSLAAQARRAADGGQFEEAQSILDTISGLAPDYPWLSAERSRITRLQEKTRLERRKSRTVVRIRATLSQRDIERTRNELQLALEEFPEDAELMQLQTELTQLEDKAKEAWSLCEAGCRQVKLEEYEAGLPLLRQASRLEPQNRQIEMALFNALVQFAKNIVDLEPQRAKHLLDEAARVSPFNLTLENATKYLYERTREYALNDCRTRVHRLCDNGEAHEALKLVTAVANQYHLHDDPVLEQIRSEIWGNFDSVGKTDQESVSSQALSQERAHGTQADTFEPPRLSESLRELRERWNRTRARVANGGKAIQSRTRESLNLSRKAYVRLPKSYKIGAGVIGLLLVVATTVVSTSLHRQPEFTRVGTATIRRSVTLLREPSASSPVSSDLKIGQNVEILTQLPAMTSEAWIRIRPAGEKQPYGYTRLWNLDQIQTGNAEFDLWHAMSFLNRTSNRNELEIRLANVDHLLQTQQRIPSRETDAILLQLSKAFANFAIGSQTDPDRARAALEKSETYLARVSGALKLSDEADELKASIQRTRFSLGEPTIAEPTIESAAILSAPPPTRNEEARMMQLAKQAYAQGTYERAADYSARVLRINHENPEARKVLEASRRAQRDLESAIVGR